MKVLLRIHLLFVIIFLGGCRNIDSTLWISNDVEKLTTKKEQKAARTNGYYRISNQSGKNWNRVNDEFILFHDGWFSAYNPTVIVNVPKDKISNGKWMNWGHYFIENDTIIIQYFEDTKTGGGLFDLYRLTVTELEGKVVNDTTIRVHRQKFNTASGWACPDTIPTKVIPLTGFRLAESKPRRDVKWIHFESGIYELTYTQPMEFNFVKYDSLPSSENWLMEEFKKNK